MPNRLVLASGSRYRRELLDRLHLPYEVIPADVDESRREGEAPADLVVRLARWKAEAVRAMCPDAWVIGSDQVIALGDEVFHKPGSRASAQSQLARLAGKTHDLLTAVCVASPGGLEVSTVTFEMKMRPLSDAEIRDYVATDEPLDCAGSYRIEAAGIRLFEYLRGDDYTAIVGLPLTRVWRHLDESGYFSNP